MGQEELRVFALDRAREWWHNLSDEERSENLIMLHSTLVDEQTEEDMARALSADNGQADDGVTQAYSEIWFIREADGSIRMAEAVTQYYAPTSIREAIISQTDWEGADWGGTVALVIAWRGDHIEVVTERQATESASIS